MARGLNRVQLIGHLGADPEMRYTAGGQTDREGVERTAVMEVLNNRVYSE